MEPEIKLTRSRSDDSSSSFGTLGYTEPHTLEGTLAFATPVAPIPATAIPATAISAAAAALSATSSTEDMLAAELLQRQLQGEQRQSTAFDVGECKATSGAGVFGDGEAGAREPAPPASPGGAAGTAGEVGARALSPPAADPSAASAGAAAFEGAVEYAA